MQHIIVNNSHSAQNPLDKQLSANKNQVVIGGHLIEFINSQKKGPKPDGNFKKKGITSQGAVNLREETVHILERCNPHNAVENSDATHLVVGYVQSGKTMSFTALTALAADNHYRMIIYLAGSKTNLLNQTTFRLKKELIGKGINNRDVFKIHQDPTMDDVDQITGNLYQDGTILLIPILKHYKHIDDLVSLIKLPDFQDAFIGETALIIDDEADQVSLNGYGRRNSQHEDEVEDKTRTYDAILRLRSALPGNSYIQYTATPQANILISMNDLLSPQSHTLLTPGEDYIGGKLFFGRGENHDLYQGRLILTIPDEEVFHKTRNPLKKMPKSLQDALLMHILAATIVIEYLHCDDVNYLSMMVHPATEKTHNKTFKKWIDNQLKTWRRAIHRPDEEENDTKTDLLKRLQELFPDAIKFYDVESQPTFEEIKPLIKNVLYSYNVYLVNTDVDAQTEIDWDDYKMHILVGAEMLNRGFTIENLATTYMPRYSVGPANADTIEQRCRFFGYKKDYIKSCRVYLPSWTVADYINYIDHEEELRKLLKQCDTLAQAERKIMLSPNMRATRANILPISIVNSQLKGHKEMRSFGSKERIYSNKRLSENFLSNHDSDFDLSWDYKTDDRCHRGFKLSIDDAVLFLEEFQFGNYRDASRKSSTIRYLRYLSQKNIDPIRYVCFVQMAYKRSSDDLRSRDFDYENLKLLTPLATGRSTSGKDVYPGDAAIVDDGTITIQLYHIRFNTSLPVTFPSDAYAIAINYPENLATNYVMNEKPYQDEDCQDEDDVN